MSAQFSETTCVTSRGPQRLLDQHGRRWDVPTLALLALVLLAFGVLVPALTFENLFADDTFSVLTGIQAFFESGNLLLGLLLLCFSVLFPAAKMVTIGVLWFARIDGTRRAEFVRWLELLGKWLHPEPPRPRTTRPLRSPRYSGMRSSHSSPIAMMRPWAGAATVRQEAAIASRANALERRKARTIDAWLGLPLTPPGSGDR